MLRSLHPIDWTTWARTSQKVRAVGRNLVFTKSGLIQVAASIEVVLIPPQAYIEICRDWRIMTKFKLSRWVRATDRQGRSEAEIHKASRHVRHRGHQYWSRNR